MWNAAGEEPPGLSEWMPPAQDGSPLWVGDPTLPPELQGIHVLGTPLGHDAFRKAALLTKRCQHDSLLDKLPPRPPNGLVASPHVRVPPLGRHIAHVAGPRSRSWWLPRARWPGTPARCRPAPLEWAAARVCREAGARVASDVIRDMTLDAPGRDARRIEVLANGLPLWQGAQAAVDTTLVSPLTRDGAPRPGADRTAAAANRKRRETYPELGGSSPLQASGGGHRGGRAVRG